MVVYAITAILSQSYCCRSQIARPAASLTDDMNRKVKNITCTFHSENSELINSPPSGWVFYFRRNILLTNSNLRHFLTYDEKRVLKLKDKNWRSYNLPGKESAHVHDRGSNSLVISMSTVIMANFSCLSRPDQ